MTTQPTTPPADRELLQLLERARDALQAANLYVWSRFQHVSKDDTCPDSTKANVRLDFDEITALCAGLTTALAQPRDPQDSVPTWAWRQAIADWWLGSKSGERVLSTHQLEIDARALAYSLAKGNPNG